MSVGTGVTPRRMPSRRVARRRLLLLVTGLLAALAVTWSAQANAAGPSAPLVVEVRTVAPGDTVWRFASAAAHPGQDVRDVVTQILELNHMGSADLEVGARVAIPVQ